MSDNVTEEVRLRHAHQQLRNDFSAWFTEHYGYPPAEEDWQDEWQTFKAVVGWLTRRQQTQSLIAEE